MGFVFRVFAVPGKLVLEGSGEGRESGVPVGKSHSTAPKVHTHPP